MKVIDLMTIKGIKNFQWWISKMFAKQTINSQFSLIQLILISSTWKFLLSLSRRNSFNLHTPKLVRRTIANWLFIINFMWRRAFPEAFSLTMWIEWEKNVMSIREIIECVSCKTPQDAQDLNLEGNFSEMCNKPQILMREN